MYKRQETIPRDSIDDKRESITMYKNESLGSEPTKEMSDTINSFGLYLVAFSCECSAISKLFSVKRYFHKAFCECGLFKSNDPDEFSKFLISKAGDHWNMKMPIGISELFLKHQGIAQSQSNMRSKSYQNAKQSLSILTQIMISHGSHDESMLTTRLHDKSMKSLNMIYVTKRRPITQCDYIDKMKENLEEHKELLDHDTVYITIFKKLGVFLQGGYIDKQIGLHNNASDQVAFDSQKVLPIVERLVTSEGSKETSYVFCANNILSPSFLAKTIQGMNSSRYMKYPGNSGDKANRYIRCATQCKSASFELSGGRMLIPSRQPKIHEYDLLKVANDGVIRKLVEFVKEQDGRFPYIFRLALIDQTRTQNGARPTPINFPRQFSSRFFIP